LKMTTTTTPLEQMEEERTDCLDDGWGDRPTRQQISGERIRIRQASSKWTWGGIFSTVFKESLQSRVIRALVFLAGIALVYLLIKTGDTESAKRWCDMLVNGGGNNVKIARDVPLTKAATTTSSTATTTGTTTTTTTTSDSRTSDPGRFQYNMKEVPFKIPKQKLYYKEPLHLNGEDIRSMCATIRSTYYAQCIVSYVNVSDERDSGCRRFVPHVVRHPTFRRTKCLDKCYLT